MGVGSPRIMAADAAMLRSASRCCQSRMKPASLASWSKNARWARPLPYLRPPVSGNGPAVQLGRAYLPVHIRGHLTVMLRAEGPRQFDLHRLRGRKSLIEADGTGGRCQGALGDEINLWSLVVAARTGSEDADASWWRHPPGALCDSFGVRLRVRDRDGASARACGSASSRRTGHRRAARPGCRCPLGNRCKAFRRG